MSEIKKDNLKNSLCYIPFAAIVLSFTEEEKSEELKKHIKHWITLLVIYILVSMLFRWLFWWMFHLYFFFWIGNIVTLIYFIVSGILWYKAYMWEDVKVDILDDMEEKFK